MSPSTYICNKFNVKVGLLLREQLEPIDGNHKNATSLRGALHRSIGGIQSVTSDRNRARFLYHQNGFNIPSQIMRAKRLLCNFIKSVSVSILLPFLHCHPSPPQFCLSLRLWQYMMGWKDWILEYTILNIDTGTEGSVKKNWHVNTVRGYTVYPIVSSVTDRYQMFMQENIVSLYKNIQIFHFFTV